MAAPSPLPAGAVVPVPSVTVSDWSMVLS